MSDLAYIYSFDTGWLPVIISKSSTLLQIINSHSSVGGDFDFKFRLFGTIIIIILISQYNWWYPSSRLMMNDDGWWDSCDHSLQLNLSSQSWISHSERTVSSLPNNLSYIIAVKMLMIQWWRRNNGKTCRQIVKCKYLCLNEATWLSIFNKKHILFCWPN